MSRTALRFVTTDDRFAIKGNAYPGIPIFFDERGVIGPLSDYFIHLVHQKRRPPSTARTYAIYLQAFLRYIAALRVEWTAVTDEVLIAWCDNLERDRGLKPATVAHYLGTVFDFFRWAEQTSRVRNVVDLYSHRDDASLGNPDIQCQISAEPLRRPGRYSWPYLPRVSGEGLRHTPTSAEIEDLHAALFNTATGQRDTLLATFYEECYLRRFEALAIRVSDIPSWDAIDDVRRKQTLFALDIIGKGSAPRTVEVLPDLMERAREHIEEHRFEVVRRARRRNPAYREPAALFLAHTTGAPVDPGHISRRISQFMRLVGIENASGHRLRARGLTNLVEACDGVDELGRPLPAEQVLWKAAYVAGHKHWQSLRPYLHMVRSGRHVTPVDELIRLQARVRILERQNAQLRSKSER